MAGCRCFLERQTCRGSHDSPRGSGSRRDSNRPAPRPAWGRAWMPSHQTPTGSGESESEKREEASGSLARADMDVDVLHVGRHAEACEWTLGRPLQDGALERVLAPVTGTRHAVGSWFDLAASMPALRGHRRVVAFRRSSKKDREVRA